jgi:hypothetical protein
MIIQSIEEDVILGVSEGVNSLVWELVSGKFVEEEEVNEEKEPKGYMKGPQKGADYLDFLCKSWFNQD